MKKTVILALSLTLLLTLACNEKASDNSKVQTTLEQNSNLSAMQVVNKRMALYNAHDYNAFIQLYDTDVKVYTFPNRLMGTGSDRLGSIFKSDFEKKSVQVEIVNQMSNGNYVINHEIVTNSGKETKYVSIYEVEDGLIKSVTFVRDF